MGMPSIEVLQASEASGWNVTRIMLARGAWPTATMVRVVNCILEGLVEFPTTSPEIITLDDSPTFPPERQSSMATLEEVTCGLSLNEDLDESNSDLILYNDEDIDKMDVSGILAMSGDEKEETEEDDNEVVLVDLEETEEALDVTPRPQGSSTPSRKNPPPEHVMPAMDIRDVPEEEMRKRREDRLKKSAKARERREKQRKADEEREKRERKDREAREKLERREMEIAQRREEKAKRERLEKELDAELDRQLRESAFNRLGPRPPPPTPILAPPAPRIRISSAPSTSRGEDRPRGRPVTTSIAATLAWDSPPAPAPPQMKRVASTSRERLSSNSSDPTPPNFRPALKKHKGYTKRRVLIIGTELPTTLLSAVPMGVDETVTLMAPQLQPGRVLDDVKSFLDSDVDSFFHIIFSDFSGILPKSDAAPRVAQGMLRRCHKELRDRCVQKHQHEPSETCWVTVVNYYATTKCFGDLLPPHIKNSRVDFLNRVSSAITLVANELPQMYSLNISRFITTNVADKFFPGSHAPRDQLKDWLREQVKKNIHCAFNYTL